MESLRQEIEQSLKSVFAHLGISESPWIKMLSESRERAQGLFASLLSNRQGFGTKSD